MSDTKLVTINVTKEDIEKGRRSDGHRCPIARAARRILKNVTFIDESLEFNNGNMVDGDSVPLTKAAQKFVRAFDDGAKRSDLKPFKFTVRVHKDFVR